jgi:hypothetical protein
MNKRLVVSIVAGGLAIALGQILYSKYQSSQG